MNPEYMPRNSQRDAKREPAITLRKLVDEWRKWLRNSELCADELSAELPKYERLAKAAEELILSTPASTPNPIVRWSHWNELRAALKEIRND